MNSLIPDGPVLLDVDDGIARIRLNRPEASNAVDVPLLQALHGAGLRCHAEPGVRVVILSGEGRNFCAGGDVKTFAAKGEALPDYLREATAWLQLATSALIQLKAPVIARIQGFAAGGAGFGFACAADLVVAGESARFFSGAVRVGMAPDAGTSVTLSRIVGLRRALDILLTNPTLTAADAHQLGIVSRVVPDDQLDQAVDSLAAELAAQPPLALAATKRLVWGGLGSGVEERLAEEARVVSELSGTADSREGLAAVIERRTPKFEGR
ncbi:enoyl-CoA hydratase/isomerase family protein [Nocardioides immobilis]|uniref:Enoyl-CoA hydratase/isomerase family protein n=1 Tax=Nocardioides immobilis TaxID=2049295 RepID=A0A417XZB8_9ACTN|nr:enoyl-CoA hydratase-related protein [Nocardioides immobilis]RHW25713.1 enoyl-CoA hydratase/isomerase family protein [Nocardioides immobilis]